MKITFCTLPSIVFSLVLNCASASSNFRTDELDSLAREGETASIKLVSKSPNIPLGNCGYGIFQFTPDDQYFINQSGSEFSLIQVDTGKIVSKTNIPCDPKAKPRDAFEAQGFTSDGKYFLVKKSHIPDHTVYILEIPSLKVVKTITPFLEQQIAFSKEGSQIVYTEWSPSVRQKKYDEEYRKKIDSTFSVCGRGPECIHKYKFVKFDISKNKKIWESDLPENEFYSYNTEHPAKAYSPDGMEISVLFPFYTFTIADLDGKILRQTYYEQKSGGSYSSNPNARNSRMFYGVDGKNFYKSYGPNHFLTMSAKGNPDPKFSKKDFETFRIGLDGIRFFLLDTQELLSNGSFGNLIQYPKSPYWSVTEDGSYRFQMEDECKYGQLYETKTGSKIETFDFSKEGQIQSCNDVNVMSISSAGNNIYTYSIDTNRFLFYSSPFSGKKEIRTTVIDAETKLPLSNANVEISLIKDTNAKKMIRSKVNTEGIFQQKVPSYDLEISFSYPGYNFLTVHLNERETWNKTTIPLLKIKPGVTFYTNQILFDSGKSELKDISKKELTRAVQLFQSNPEMRLVIIGHTDNVGNDAENQKLSLARALEVKDFLIKNGIKESRLTVEGRGSKEPVASNGTELGKAQNRRIQFVLK